MTPNLTQRPSRSRLRVILRFIDKSFFQWRDAFGNQHRERKSLRKGGDVTKRHDTWEARVSTRLCDVVDHGGDSACVDYELGKIWCMPGNLTNTSCSVLADELVDVLEAMQDSWENLGFHYDFSKIDRVLSNLRKA